MNLIPTDKPLFWFARGNGVLHSGVTYPGQVTCTGLEEFVTGEETEVAEALLKYKEELTNVKVLVAAQDAKAAYAMEVARLDGAPLEGKEEDLLKCAELKLLAEEATRLEASIVEGFADMEGKLVYLGADTKTDFTGVTPAK